MKALVWHLDYSESSNSITGPDAPTHPRLFAVEIPLGNKGHFRKTVQKILADRGLLVTTEHMTEAFIPLHVITKIEEIP